MNNSINSNGATQTELINQYIKENKSVISVGELSDTYHTFGELYYHRMVLFSVICNTYRSRAWKSWLHHDGTMYDDYFIVGVTTNEGDFTYHYHKDHWDMFKVRELPKAPEWDGHISEDITRLVTGLEHKDVLPIQLNVEGGAESRVNNFD